MGLAQEEHNPPQESPVAIYNHVDALSTSVTGQSRMIVMALYEHKTPQSSMYRGAV